VIEYAVRRLLYGALVLFMVILFVFFGLRLTPGNAVLMQIAEAPGITQEQIDQRMHNLGLDQSVMAQLGDYLRGIVRLDFGKSFQTEMPVMTMVAERLIATLELGILALILACLLGVPLGMLSALHPNTITDQLLRVVSVLGLSIPSFWLGLMMLTYAALWFDWTPPLAYTEFTADPWRNLRQMAMPAVALAVGSMATIARFLRSSLLEVLESNFIRTVRAKGAGVRLVVFKHSVRNSLLPVFTILGLQVGHILGGTVILEAMFSIPGMGTLLAEGVRQRDYPLVMACVIVFAAVFILVTIVVDLLYGVIDPRVRYR